METYSKLSKRHQEEVNNFPMFFAFNNNQFKEGMESLGLKETDTDKIYSIGCGGYIRKTDSKAFGEMLSRHSKEQKEAMQNEEFAYQAFLCELNNHEYSYTEDPTDALNALGLSMSDVKANEVLKNAYKRAEKKASVGCEW